MVRHEDISVCAELCDIFPASIHLTLVTTSNFDK